MPIRSLRSGLAISLLLGSLAGCVPNHPDAAFRRVPVPASLPPQDVVLEVSGPKTGTPIRLDLTTLCAFPATRFTIRDPWDLQEHLFEGVLLLPLLQRLGLGAGAELIEVSAANGYRAASRIADLRRFGYLLAYQMDGELTADRKALTKRGALQTALDFDGRPKLSVDVYKHQLVWQVVRIEVK